jgi:hypothetical protein
MKHADFGYSALRLCEDRDMYIISERDSSLRLGQDEDEEPEVKRNERKKRFSKEACRHEAP